MSVKYTFIGDNSQLRKVIQDTVSGMQGMENQAGQTGSAMEGMFKKGALAFGAYFGARQMIGFARQIATVRAEFQDAETSMAVFLKSGERATQFIGELQKYAYYNMFEFSDLVQASKQMLAFGHNVEDVIPSLDRLSNIATGTKSSLNEIVYLYNKAKAAGEVTALNVQSWAIRGVVLSDVMEELGIQTDSASVSFENLQKVLAHLTDEGGMFHNLMANQMSNISAEIGQLQDNIALMFNEIGKRSEGVITGTIKSLSYLVEHWEKVFKVIGTLVIAYGSYRAALALNHAWEKASTKYKDLQTAAIVRNNRATSLAAAGNRAHTKTITVQTIAWKGLTAAIHKSTMALMKSPVFWIGAAIAGVVLGLRAWRNAETELEKAQRRHNEALERRADLMEQLKNDVDSHLSTLRNQNATILDQVKAYNKLKELLPEVYGSMSFHDVLNLTKEQNENLTTQAYLNSEIAGEKERLAKLESELAELEKVRYNEFTGFEQAKTRRERRAIKAKKEEIELAQREIEIGNERREQIRLISIAERGSPEARQAELKIQQDKLAEITKQREALEEQIKSQKFLFNQEWERMRLQGRITELMEEERKQRENVRILTPTTSADDNLRRNRERARQELNAARAELGRIMSSPDATVQQHEQAVARLQRAEEAYTKLGGTIRNTTREARDFTDELRRNAREQQRIAEDLESTIRQTEIGLEQEGLDKELMQIRFNTDQRIRALNRQREDLIETIIKNQALIAQAEIEGKGGTFDEAAWMRQNRERITEEFFSSEVAESFVTMLNQVDRERLVNEQRLYERMTEMFKSFEQQKTDIQTRAEEQRMALRAKLGTGDITEDEFFARLNNIETATTEAMRNVRREELGAIDETKELFVNLFSDLSMNSKKTLRGVIADTEQLLAYLEATEQERLLMEIPVGFSEEDIERLELNADKVRQIVDQLNHQMNQLDRRSTHVGSSFVNALNKLKQLRNENEKLTDIQREQLRIGAMEDLKKGATEVLAITQNITSQFAELARASGNEELAFNLEMAGKGMNVLGKAAAGDWVGAALGAIDIMVSFIARRRQMEEQNREMLRQAAKDAKEYQHALKLIALTVQREENLFGERTFAMTAQAAQKATESLKAYHEQLRTGGGDRFSLDMQAFRRGDWANAIQKETLSLANMQVKTQNEVKRFLRSNIAAQYTSLSDLAPGLFDVDGSINIENARAFLETNTQITAEQRRQIEQAIEFKEKYKEAIKVIEDELRSIYGSIAGELIGLITSSIQAGTDEWKDFQKAGTKAIEALGERLLYELFMAQAFDQLEEDLKASRMRGGSAQEQADREMRILTGFFDGIGDQMEQAANFAQEFQRKAQESGFNAWMDQQQIQGTAGKWQGLSQQTGDALEGRFTALQMSGVNIDETTKDILQTNNAIARIMSDSYLSINLIVKQGEQKIEQLKLIAGHSSKFDNIIKTLGEIKNDTQYLR